MNPKKPLILCVDDEKIILNNLIQQLKSAFGSQYSYETAESAEEAFEVLEELDSPVVLVISDWLMPGTKGDVFLEKFKRNFPRAVTVMLTGQADEEAIKRAYENAGLFACIKKPWNKDLLIQKIQEAIEANRL